MAPDVALSFAGPPSTWVSCDNWACRKNRIKSVDDDSAMSPTVRIDGSAAL